VVVLYSSLSPGFTDAGSVVGQIQAEMTNFDAPKSIKFDFTGQIEEQKANVVLNGALFTGLGLIMLILVFQFIPFKTSNYNGCVFLSFIEYS
jgi:multidrug efflux pump subunit AcrB